ncbi:MAG: thiol-activated cytolysin family protein [Pirellulaceae bacterium]
MRRALSFFAAVILIFTIGLTNSSLAQQPGRGQNRKQLNQKKTEQDEDQKRLGRDNNRFDLLNQKSLPEDKLPGKNLLINSSPMIVVKSGAATNSELALIRKSMSPDQRSQLRRVTQGNTKENNACVISTEKAENIEPVEKEGEPVKEGDFICTPITVEETVNNQQHYILGVMNRLYPGMIMDGQRLSDGQFVEIPDARNPFTLVYANGPFLKGRETFEVKDPSFDTVHNATTKMLQQGVKGKTTANLSYSIESIHSQEHFNLKLGANIHYGAASVATDFGIDWSTKKSKILVTFKQPFYEFHADRIDAENAFVDRKVLPTDLFVSRIAYGRLLLFSIESDESLTDLEAAVSATFNAVAASGNVDLEGQYETTLKSSTIKAYVQGGSAKQAVDIITNGFDGIKNYINNGSQFDPFRNPGSPMVYELTYLSSGLTANIITSTSYTYSVCRLNTGRFLITVKDFECLDTTTLNPTAKMYGEINVKAYRYHPGFATQVIGEGTPIERTITIDHQLVDSKEVWNAPASNYVPLKKGDVEKINSTFEVAFDDFETLDLGKSYIEIKFDLYEKDTAQKDKLDISSKKIYLNEIMVDPGAVQDMTKFAEQSYKFNDKKNFDFILHYTASPK